MIFLNTVLGDSVLLFKFAEYLHKEQRQELLEFWLRVELFCNIEDPKKLYKTATKIYKLHIRTGALNAVNLDPENKRILCDKINAKIISSNMFQTLQNDARVVLQFECLPRFCSGMSEFLELVSQHPDYNSLATSYKFASPFCRVLKKYCAALLKCTPAKKRYSMQIMQGIRPLSSSSASSHKANAKRSMAKMAKQKALERQKSLIRQKSLERQKSLDRQKSFERQKSLERQMSFHRQPSLSRQFKRGKSFEGERYRLSMMLS